MGVSKVKYCKCGHEKNQHKKKNSKLPVTSYCRECPCSLYLNRKLPDKLSYVSTILTVGLFAFFMIISYVMITGSDPALTGIEDQIISITIGEIHKILFLIVVAINIAFLFWFVLDPIFEIINAKKRPEFPIVEKNDQL